MDEENVQTGVVSEGAPPKGQATPAPPSSPSLSTEEIQRMINQGIMEGIERAKQSARDTARFEVESLQKRVAQTRIHSEAAMRQLEQYDPAEALKLRQAQFQGDVNQRQLADQEEQQQARHAQFVQDFYRVESEAVAELGVDPKDTRIDWGNDAASPTEAHKRILKSAMAIAREQLKAERSARDETLNREANSVNTSITPGGSGGDKGFLAKWGSGELPVTKENVARARKLTGI